MVRNIEVAERYYEIAVSRDTRATVVTVEGEMDLFAAPELARVLRRALEDPQPIVVDLTGCRLFESSGLNALLQAQLEALESDRKIVVVRSPDGCANRTLSLTVPGFFAEHESRESALAAV